MSSDPQIGVNSPRVRVHGIRGYVICWGASGCEGVADSAGQWVGLAGQCDERFDDLDEARFGILSEALNTRRRFGSSPRGP